MLRSLLSRFSRREAWHFSVTFMDTQGNRTFSCMDATIKQTQESVASFLSFWTKWMNILSSTILDLVCKNPRSKLPELLFTKRWRQCRIFSPWRARLLAVILARQPASTWQQICSKPLVMIVVELCWSTAIFMYHPSSRIYPTSKVLLLVKKPKKQQSKTRRHSKKMRDQLVSRTPSWRSSMTTKHSYNRTPTPLLAVNQLQVRTTCKRRSL